MLPNNIASTGVAYQIHHNQMDKQNIKPRQNVPHYLRSVAEQYSKKLLAMTLIRHICVCLSVVIIIIVPAYFTVIRHSIHHSNMQFFFRWIVPCVMYRIGWKCMRFFINNINFNYTMIIPLSSSLCANFIHISPFKILYKMSEWAGSYVYITLNENAKFRH